ncbi:MAG: hypothetical protein HQL78_13120 [Magnetococcales bacterium]|nr:hypothetical protein [Magnetococcales bacterium]
MLELRIIADTPNQMASMLSLLNSRTNSAFGTFNPEPPIADFADITTLEPDVSSESTDVTVEEATTPTVNIIEDDVPSPGTPEELVYTIDDVRDALTKINNTHGLQKAKEFMEQFGVARIKDCPQEKYAEVIAAARELVQ